MSHRTGTVALVAALLVACGGTPRVGELEISDAWARPTPAQSSVAAVYVRITSPVADELIEVSTARSETASLHAYAGSGSPTDGHMGHRSDGGSGSEAKMIEAGLVLEPNSPVEFAPGGMHIMLEGLKQPLIEGESFELVLTFREAGERRVIVNVSTNAEYR